MEYKCDADILSMTKNSKNLFHEMTFTSVLCAFIHAAGVFPNRISQIAMLPSTEQEANTKGSVGLHCTITSDGILITGLNHVSRQYIYPFLMDNQSRRYKFRVLLHTCRSSTLPVCPTKGVLSTFHVEPDTGSHRWIELLQSPVKMKYHTLGEVTNRYTICH